MLFDIQPKSSVPIYEQIVAQITYGIASGGLEVGMLIPSVRELASNLTVHPNTVARAYQELERQGMLTVRRGKGMEVAAAALRLSRNERQEKVRARIREALREAVSSALSPEEIRKLVDEELAHCNGQHRSREKP
jgi:GntR family transcriptional regulator